MKLLDAKTVRAGKSKSEKERIKRVAKLNAEEISISKRLNTARVNEEKVYKEIEAGIIAKQIMAKEEEEKIRKHMSSVFSEVKVLEARKEKAMKPVDELLADNQQRAEVLVKEAVRLNTARSELAEEVSWLAERKEEVTDRENEIANLKYDAEQRQKAVTLEEARLEHSQKKLMSEWSLFYVKMEKANVALKRSRSEIEADRLILAEGKKSNKIESERLIQADRAVRDKYKALEQATKHIYGKCTTRQQ